MKKLFTLIILLSAGVVFFHFSSINYEKQKEIKSGIITKPNSLPKSEYAKLTAFGFQNVKADFYWMSIIQYIGSSLIKSEYKPYLHTMTDLITELNPYYEEPYVMAELLLPSYNPRYEKLDNETQNKYINQAINIGEKAIEKFCDMKKVKLVKNENNLKKLFTEKKYQNTCKEGYAIYNLAYIYFQYKKNPEKAAEYYKLASVSSGAPEGAKTMIAVMQAKAGVREKSYFMFLNMAKYKEKGDTLCSTLGNDLENIGKAVFFGNGKLHAKLIQDLEKIRKENFPFNPDDGLENTKCTTFLQKAIRELNAHYLDEAEKKYFSEKGIHSKNAKELFDAGFIKYLPLDFQQYEDYGIIYTFNPDTNSYDFKMGKYEE